MRPATRYNEPYSWWGPGWQERTERSLADLLRDRTIDLERAAFIWAGLARRQSLAVIAGPSGAGKTTLLTALLPLLPSETRRVYLRGGFETFAFLGDAAIEPGNSALLINEISPHLPVYLWGPAVRKALAAKSAGFMLLATAHAESAAQFVSLLAGSPLRVPVVEIAAFDLVVLLEASHESESGRRVAGVWRMTPAREGVSLTEWGSVTDPSRNISHKPCKGPTHNRPALPPWEIPRRIEFLTRLREGRIAALPETIVADCDGHESR